MKKVLAAFMIALIVFTGCKNQKFTLYIYGDESGYYTEADAERMTVLLWESALFLLMEKNMRGHFSAANMTI